MTSPFRLATANDTETVIDLVAQARRWQSEIGQPAAFGSDRRSEVAASVQAGTCYIGFEDGEAVAAFSLELSDPDVWLETPGPARFLHRLVVRPDMHNRGLGITCMNFAEELAVAQGAEFLCLDAVEDNVQLCNWYERRGYERVGFIKLPHWTRGSALFQKRLTVGAEVPHRGTPSVETSY